MVNKLQGNYANLNALLAQSVNNSNQTSMPTGLQSRAHLAPSTAIITDEMLSQFSDEQVDEILNQQLSSLLTISSAPSGSNYKLSSEEVALRTVISSQQEGLLKNERSDQLIERLNSSVKNIQGAYANTSDILSNLGQLGFNQKTFLASSQQRVERSLDPFMESFNRERYEDDDNYGFTPSGTGTWSTISSLTALVDMDHFYDLFAEQYASVTDAPGELVSSSFTVPS